VSDSDLGAFASKQSLSSDRFPLYRGFTPCLRQKTVPKYGYREFHTDKTGLRSYMKNVFLCAMKQACYEPLPTSGRASNRPSRCVKALTLSLP
jgi:hypothetical protein